MLIFIELTIIFCTAQKNFQLCNVPFLLKEHFAFISLQPYIAKDHIKKL